MTANLHLIKYMYVYIYKPVFIFTVQLSPSDKPYLNALYDAAYSGREMWSNIGNNLGLSGDDLSAIRTNNPLDVGGCFRAMLLKWFQSGSNCYLETFLSALESKTVGLGNLCSDVEGAILKIANGPQGMQMYIE